jgi:hypothetical protein
MKRSLFFTNSSKSGCCSFFFNSSRSFIPQPFSSSTLVNVTFVFRTSSNTSNTILSVFTGRQSPLSRVFEMSTNSIRLQFFWHQYVTCIVVIVNNDSFLVQYHYLCDCIFTHYIVSSVFAASVSVYSYVLFVHQYHHF